MNPSNPTTPPRRRGAALVLVVVALAIGLLLTATWLDGRRESMPVARRIADGAVARHAAMSGLDLALATLDAEHDWRDAIERGVLDDAFEFDGASIEIEATDAEDGRPVDDDTLRVRFRCQATVDGIVVACERTREFEPTAPVVDLGFGETAIVAEREIRILDRAAIVPWSEGPGGTMIVGTLDGDPGSVEFGRDAVVSSTEVIRVRQARSADDGDRRHRTLPEGLPPIAAPRIEVVEGSPACSRRPTRLTEVPSNDSVHAEVRIPRGRHLEVDGDLVIRCLRDFEMEPGSSIHVERGRLTLDVDRDVRLRDARMTVGEAGSILVRAGRRMWVDDSTLGVERDREPSRDDGRMLSPAAHAGPARVVLTGGRNSELRFKGRSTGVFSVVAPEAEVRLEDEVAIHGRLVAERVELRDASVLFARPEGGRMIGLSSEAGPHRDAQGRLLPILTSIDRCDASRLAEIAEALGVPVCAAGSIARPSDAAREARADAVEESMERRRSNRRDRRPDTGISWVAVEDLDS